MIHDQTARSLSAILLDTNTNNCGHDDTKIIKFSQRKNITKQLSKALNAVCETSAYHRMSRCADTLFKQDDTIVSCYYCQNRLCSVCNSHRSQKYYLQYKDSLASIGDQWYMVTLTIPNVTDLLLRRTIISMKTTFRSILDTANKRHRRATGEAYFHGILATECTRNEDANTYHPHFHVLVHGKDRADHLMFEWLRHNDTATIEAQNTKPINGLDDSLREIFKYSIKGADAKTPPEAVHIMAQAFKHLRSIQPFGSVKAKKLDQDQDTPEAVTGDKVKFDATKPFDIYRYYHVRMNWYRSDGKALIPDEDMIFSRKALNTLASMNKTTLRIYRKPQAKYERL